MNKYNQKKFFIVIIIVVVFPIKTIFAQCNINAGNDTILCNNDTTFQRKFTPKNKLKAFKIRAYTNFGVKYVGKI